MRKILHGILAIIMMFSAVPALQVKAADVTSTNYIKNSGFEDGMNDWVITAGSLKSDEGGPQSGQALNYWKALEAQQILTGLPEGVYTLKLSIHGAGEPVEISAKISGEAPKVSTVTNTGWGNWLFPEITDIQVTTDQILTIGMSVSGGDETWGWIDDVELIKQVVQTADKADLQACIDLAVQKNESEYTTYSWGIFAAEFAEAQDVLAKIDATGEEVAAAINQLSSAMKGLSKKQVINYDTIHVNPIDGLQGRTDFINGVDVSSLSIVVKKGAEFSDLDGSQPYPDDQIKNCLAILKNHGVNWIRLRIWNDPKGALSNPKYADKGPGGINDLAVTKEIAVKAKELGLNFLLDFHYSDTWAHPGQQIKPEAWNGLNFEELTEALYKYTDEVLEELGAANALPDMVQIGNENNDGMVHAEGKVDPNGTSINPSQYVALVKAGIKAVRDNELSGEKIKVMIHLAEGGKNSLFRRRFDLLQENNVDYDIIGASYYPYWHGPMNAVQTNLNDMAVRYNKEVVIAEVAYGYTNESDNSIYPNGTKMENIYEKGLEKDGKFKTTIQGQATALRDVIEIAAKVPGNKGIGTFYWEPAWLTTPEMGSGWGAGTTSASWANQALFNYRGQALPSIDTYNLTTSSTYIIPSILSVSKDPININISQGDELILPNTIDGIYSDDSIKGIAVEWENVNQSLINQVGTFTVSGQLVGRNESVQANVTVNPKNYVTNPSFELGNNSWTLTGNSVAARNESSNAKNGSWALNYGDSAFTAEQTITGLKNGTYTLRLWVQGDTGKTVELFAEDFGGERKALTITKNGWIKWLNPEIANIHVTNNQCRIGIASNGGSNWGWVDGVELVLVSPEQSGTVNKSQLQAAIDFAVQKVESDYTALSWNAFKTKLIAAQSIVIKQDASAEEVLKATTELNAAINNLVKNQTTSTPSNPSSGGSGSSSATNANTTVAETIINKNNTADEKLNVFKKIGIPALPQGEATQLTDISKHWASDSIKAIVSNGIMVGKTAKEFAPQDSLNRCEMAAILGRLIPEAKENTKIFKDIKGNEWYAQSINRMAALGLLGGYADNNFKPKENIKRVEVMVILSRLAAYNHTYQEIQNTDELLKGYKDADSIPSWAKTSVAWSIKYGIIKGNVEDMLNPNQNITRAEIASILDRMLELQKDSTK